MTSPLPRPQAVTDYLEDLLARISPDDREYVTEYVESLTESDLRVFEISLDQLESSFDLMIDLVNSVGVLRSFCGRLFPRSIRRRLRRCDIFVAPFEIKAVAMSAWEVASGCIRTTCLGRKIYCLSLLSCRPQSLHRPRQEARARFRVLERAMYGHGS